MSLKSVFASRQVRRRSCRDLRQHAPGRLGCQPNPQLAAGLRRPADGSKAEAGGGGLLRRLAVTPGFMFHVQYDPKKKECALSAL